MTLVQVLECFRSVLRRKVARWPMDARRAEWNEWIVDVKSRPTGRHVRGGGGDLLWLGCGW